MISKQRWSRRFSRLFVMTQCLPNRKGKRKIASKTAQIQSKLRSAPDGLKRAANQIPWTHWAMQTCKTVEWQFETLQLMWTSALVPCMTFWPPILAWWGWSTSLCPICSHPSSNSCECRLRFIQQQMCVVHQFMAKHGSPACLFLQ